MNQDVAGQEMISHYRVLRMLGKGGMGEVYLAQDTKLERLVALKLLPSIFAADKQRLRRFIQEAKAVSALNHPNICVIYEVDETKDGRPFIAMEHVEGQTLADKIHETPQDIGSILDFGIQVADALEEAHSRGIVHRDIKPANIMVTPRRQVKVLDFGLAKVMPPEFVITDTGGATQTESIPGTLLGTLQYMSPEQALGREVDRRSDIFSLGVVLYEMATGDLPFKASSQPRLLYRILNSPVPTVKNLRPDLADSLGRIVSKALEKDPETRYQSAKELLVDLKRLARDLDSGVATTGDHSLQRPAVTGQLFPATVRRFVGNRSYLVALAVVLILCLGVVIFRTGPGLFSPKSKLASVAILPCRNIGAGTEEYWADGITETIINDLSMLSGIRVTSFSAVTRYRKEDVDPRQVGQHLGVESLLESSVQRGDSRLRVTARLIRTMDGFQMWAGHYDLSLDDIFKLQDTVATEIARALHARFAGEEQGRVFQRGTKDPEAYELYLQGRYHFYKYNRSGIEKAIELYRQALVKDPNFSLAHGGLSLCYSQYRNFNWDSSPVWVGRALESGKRALALAPRQAEAHFALGFAYHQENENERAVEELEKTVQLNPNHAHAHSLLGFLYYQFYGQLDRAVEQYDTALTLDPFLLSAYWHRGNVCRLLGNYSEALVSLRKAQELSPNSEYTWMFTAALHTSTGDSTRADQAVARMLEVAPLNPLAHWHAGRTCEVNENYNRALKEYETALQLDPKFFLAHAGRARALFHLNRLAEALSACDNALKLSEGRMAPLWFSHPNTRALRALILSSTGKEAESAAEFSEVLGTLEKGSSHAVEIYQMARVYALMGRTDEAFHRLQRARGLGLRSPTLFQLEPDLKLLRNDPRFNLLLLSEGNR